MKRSEPNQTIFCFVTRRRSPVRSRTETFLPRSSMSNLLSFKTDYPASWRPPGSGYAWRMRIRIQEVKNRQKYAKTGRKHEEKCKRLIYIEELYHHIKYCKKCCGAGAGENDLGVLRWHSCDNFIIFSQKIVRKLK